MIITTDNTHSHGALHYQGSESLLSFSTTWSNSMCKALITLQEHQTAALMLHRIAFHFSGG